MIDVITTRFEQEKDNRTYRRIDAEHPISIYLGYNKNGNKSLVITEEGKEILISSTKIIRMDLFKRSDDKLAVEFSLLDDRFSSLFYKFCEDIITSSKSVKKEDVIYFISNRWDAWKLMFKNTSISKLSESEIQGLIGELIFIEKVMIPKYGVERSISAWDGPLGNPKDFVIDNTWYEVKTTTMGNMIVKINSLEQLDSENEGNLEVVRIERSNNQSATAINLNKQVEAVKLKIQDIRILKEYINRLSMLQYCYDEYYNSICYEYRALDEYKVDDNFPRIKRRDIPNVIIRVQYELNLSTL